MLESIVQFCLLIALHFGKSNVIEQTFCIFAFKHAVDAATQLKEVLY